MTQLVPGDIVFGYADLCYRAFGVVERSAYECMKPDWCKNDEWINEGWDVIVRWTEIDPIPVRDHIFEKSGPFRLDVGGVSPIQGYLFEMPQELYELFLRVIGINAEEQMTFRECANPFTKLALVKVRCDQTAYRKGVLRLGSECRITKTKDVRLLEAAHLKPHSKCDGREAADPHNGTALTPTMHTMFDAGYFTFEDNGDIRLSPHTPRELFEQNGGVLRNTGPFRPEQVPYLTYHRENVFRA
jgi:hypothetical protein